MDLYAVFNESQSTYILHTNYLSFHKTMTGAFDAFVKEYNRRNPDLWHSVNTMSESSIIIYASFSNVSFYIQKMHFEEDVLDDKVYVLRDGGDQYEVVADRQMAINKMVERAKQRAEGYNCPIQKLSETVYLVGSFQHAIDEYQVID